MFDSSLATCGSPSVEVGALLHIHIQSKDRAIVAVETPTISCKVDRDVQGDHVDCSKPPVDFDWKVTF